MIPLFLLVNANPTDNEGSITFKESNSIHNVTRVYFKLSDSVVKRKPKVYTSSFSVGIKGENNQYEPTTAKINVMGHNGDVLIAHVNQINQKQLKEATDTDFVFEFKLKDENQKEFILYSELLSYDKDTTLFSNSNTPKTSDKRNLKNLKKNNNKDNTGTIILCVVVAAAVVIAIILLFVFLRKRK